MQTNYQFFDPAVLMRSVEGDTASFVQLSEIFLRTAPEILMQLVIACRAGEVQTAAREAHSFKGTAELIGAHELAKLAQDFEKQLRNTVEVTDSMNAVLDILAQDLSKLLAELTTCIASLNADKIR